MIEGIPTLQVVSVLFRQDNRFLLAERRGTHAGQLCCPGGKVDPPESIEAAAIREVLEETGCQCKILKKLSQTPLFASNKSGIYRMHYFLGELIGEPRHMEPEKLGPWEWILLPKLTMPTKFILERLP